jgi:2-polyprenyl-3-methyl-5-hydroxy-6-metoxy-1,4-benzoquinol methylase
MKRVVKSILRPVLKPVVRRLVRTRLVRRVVRRYGGDQVDEGEYIPLEEQDVSSLRAMLRYLIHDTSNMRRQLRYLIAENAVYQSAMQQTANSFNYQWKALPESEHLLTNPAFQNIACDQVCEFSGLDRGWFVGKRVLDAGCGNGRFSWALAKLGAEVTAFDLSENGLANLQREATAAGLKIRAFRHNVLQPVDLPPRSFDLVWSFGVLHHTGDTYKGFRHLCPLVAEGGYFFLMVYGEPRLNAPWDFTELNNYERLRQAASNKSYEQVIEILKNDPVVSDLHGWFDAISPNINDLYTFEEVEGWLAGAGFGNVRRTFESRNLFIISQRLPACPLAQVDADARGRQARATA